MKISYSWIQDYLPLDLPVEELSEILTSIGLEVGGVERVESVQGGLHGVVAGKVQSCEKHPNADRLSLCTVHVGNSEPLQIVCGAPNVAVGQTVWVAVVGTTLFPVGSDEPFVINKVKVRGETSEGMICADDELGIGEDHSGIMVLSDDIEVGTLAREYYDVREDVVFEIDLTPNRSDATSHLGVAEDIAAYLKVNTDLQSGVLWPVSGEYPEIGRTPVTVEVEDSNGCPRYAGLTIEGIEIKESPDWLKNRLQAIGVRPISNIVDITNFVLHEMGQPLHAFDADKIAGSKIIVKTLDGGTSFVTLDDVERKLMPSDLLICDGQSRGMCIAGVFGGIGTGVSDETNPHFS